jgi:coiled-coil domain-containing protein 130
MFFYL